MFEFVKKNARWLSGGALITFAACFGQTFFISLFANNIMSSYALTHGQWGRLYFAGTLASSVLMFFAGGLSDRYPIRHLASAMLLVLAAACVLMAVNTSALFLVLIIFLLRFSGQGMATHTANVAMSRWFNANRGWALAIASLGFSIGESTLPWLVVQLKPLIDWRTIWWICALLSSFYALAVWRVLATERSAQNAQQHVDQPSVGGKNWRRAQVLRSSIFWLIAPTLIIPATVTTTLFFQQLHLLDSKQWLFAYWAAFIPIYSALSVCAAFFWASMIKRFGAYRLTPLILLPIVPGLSAIYYFDHISAAYFALICFALMQGAAMTVLSAFWAEVFGTAHLGSNKVLGTVLMVLGSASGPAISGTLIDQGLSFVQQMPAICVLVVFASALALWAQRQV